MQTTKSYIVQVAVSCLVEEHNFLETKLLRWQCEEVYKPGMCAFDIMKKFVPGLKPELEVLGDEAEQHKGV